MAKHHGCPECQAAWHGQPEGFVEHRAASPTQHAHQPAGGSIFNPFYTGRPRTPTNGNKSVSIDRQDLIRRIKRGESRPTSPELERSLSPKSSLHNPPPAPHDETSIKPTEPPPKAAPFEPDNQSIGQQIERPRSALHRGDFREKADTSSAFERFGENGHADTTPPLATSPVAPWHSDFPAAALRRSQPAISVPAAHIPFQARSRAISSASFASSFAYKPPTSPLVQSSRPDTPEPASRRKSRSPDKSRRHTFSPHALIRGSSALDYPSSTRQPPSLRSERTYPYQAHQPRRSINSFGSLPQTPTSRARRPSLSDSPLHHAAMVGSYEESILRGRMSTTPSKPLNFVAQIGVSGRGEGKANLLCPPHATVPFPAVFYSYGSGTRIVNSSDQPSPYVGLIDLENNLPPAQTSPEKVRRRAKGTLSNEGSRSSSHNRADENTASEVQARRRKRQKQKRRSGSPRAPPGGSYRIPQQGQIQIVIKNPNKTAVKLFLVPYDLSDMEPGQKTFIRQRSYSAGPIIDMPLSSRTNLGTDRPEASIPANDDPKDRPMLRYLIHLHICCPSKGRYFLHKSIRVVFANRVPDGKEKLRNEIQLPEPKYSTYRPGRDSNAGLAPNTTPGSAARRRSAIEESTIEAPWHPQFLAQSLPLAEHRAQAQLPSQPLSFHRTILPTLESRPASRQFADDMDVDSEPTREGLANGSTGSPPVWELGSPLNAFRKLDEPFSFDRDRSRERKVDGQSQSLLSRKLRDLAFQAHGNGGT